MPRGPLSGQFAQECGPELLGVRRADTHAERLAPTGAVDTHRDDHRDGDDAPVLACFT